MKKRALLALPALLFAAAVVVGCTSTPKGDGSRGNTVTLKQKDISFKSEAGSLTISNETLTDVVIFAGKVEKNAVLGGIKAGQSRSFNLANLPGIPDSGSLLIRAATMSTYRGKARLTEADVIYTGLVVYNLKDKNDKNHISIYAGVDTNQQTCIYVSNESEHYVLELQMGDPGQGEVIATLPPLQTNKRIYLAPREDGIAYDFYPRFVFVNPKTGDKTSMTAGKADRKRAIPEKVGENLTPMRFTGPSASNIGYDVAFINLQNDTSSSIEFRNAETTLKNQKGLRLTPSGRLDVYEIPAANGNAGQTYSALTFEFDNFDKKTINPYKFKAGYKYDVIVTQMNGNYQYDIREVGQKSLVEDSRVQLFME
ncbi:MAG: hypothetical protein ACTTKL_02475 [Treponema sp.]